MTALETTRANIEAARAAMATIQAQLDELEKQAEAMPRNWGYAGTTGYISAALNGLANNE